MMQNIHNIKLELNGPGYNYNGKFSEYKSLKVSDTRWNTETIEHEAEVDGWYNIIRKTKR